MIRTINERKAFKYIFLGFVLNYISLYIFGQSVREPNIIIGSLFMCLYFVGLGLLCYNFYSLGWEYKRLNLEKDTEDQAKTKEEQE